MSIEIPLTNEVPSEYADRLGLEYTSIVTTKYKKDLGQFFTPSKVSRFMADFSIPIKEKLRILDPGCGIGILSCSLVEKIIYDASNVKEIELVAFELDNELLEFTDRCLTYLSEWAQSRKVKFTYFLCKNDFILHNSIVLQDKMIPNEYYDVIISNPPYFKIPKNDLRSIAATSVIHGQTNIYSIFLLIAAKLLGVSGQLIFITPRSFSSGSYFRLFRERFFTLVSITDVHLFESRKETFERDKVLQESIIVVAVKREYPLEQLVLPFENFMKISTSKGISDVGDRKTKEYKFEDLVNMNSVQKIFHIPVSRNDDQAIKLFKSWTGSLHSYGMEISTGRVVDFRSLDFITEVFKENCVPLIYLHNIDKMKFVYPNNSLNKGKSKGQFIIRNEKSFSRLVCNKDYVLLRRFSSKDDYSRLVASPYFSNWLSNYKMIGIENHLNYIYRPNGKLTEYETYGIAAILNSKLFDVYFRTFNGNINVSATELRDMPLPKLKEIQAIGKAVVQKKKYDQDFINSIVFKKLKIDLTYL